MGISLCEAVRTFSGYNLNMRLLAEKIDAELPEGTILAQSPEAGTKVKPRQNIFIVVSKHPPTSKAPSFIGLSEQECLEKAHELSIRVKIFKIIAPYPSGTCFTQMPCEGDDLENKTVILYVSGNQTTQLIMPRLNGKSLHEAIEVLNTYNFETEIMRGNEIISGELNEYILISDHKPRAGCIIDPQKQKTIRLYIE